MNMMTIFDVKIENDRYEKKSSLWWLTRDETSNHHQLMFSYSGCLHFCLILQNVFLFFSELFAMKKSQIEGG